ncbi:MULTISPECIES: hypothetical protein [unclassified Microbispora]|uniref:hypothetical protein n=1 Tax=unclassified Microbispora TaxID=2614687 RepID=UPI0016033AC5|nr:MULTISPECIES: hypothetical protein [unclassified Microbispora]
MRGERRVTGKSGSGALWRVPAWLTAVVALLTSLVVTSSPAAAGQPYGPYTCASGYVWREAYAGDQVCVTPAIRTQTATENALGPSRREPNGGPYGPDTCKQGYVWRETRPSDHVCVPPASRDQAYSDNSNAVLRLADPGGTPHGGVSISTSLNQTGGRLYANGSGLTPNGTIWFYAVGIGTTGPFVLGTRTADASGNLPGWQYVADVWCRSYQTGPAPIVVLDVKAGLVTTAGTTTAFLHCG